MRWRLDRNTVPKPGLVEVGDEVMFHPTCPEFIRQRWHEAFDLEEVAGDGWYVVEAVRA